MNCGFGILNNVIVDALRESNAIEGVYDDASLKQAGKAWNYVRKQDVITPEVVCMTHAILMRDQPLKREEIGEFRRIAVFVGNHRMMQPERIGFAVQEWCDEMNKDVRDREWEEIDQLGKDLHVKYESIHPFVDGNGRTGRIFLNWWRIRQGIIPMVIWEAERAKYYEWFRR